MPSIPIQGMDTDREPFKQDENKATFVLNAVNDSRDGSAGTLVNAEGNELCFSLTSGYNVVGHCIMDDNEVCIFSTDGTNSEIGIVQHCNYTAYVNTTCLNFSNFIQAEYRLRQGDQRYVYWVDGENPDRYINLDDLESFQTSGSFDCDLMDMNKSYDIPTVDLTTFGASSACGILSGSFSLGFAYLDSDGSPIEYFGFTEFIPVYDDSFNNWDLVSYDNIEGNYNIDNFTAVQGGLPKVNKFYRFTLNGVDTSFSRLKVVAIYYKSGDGVTRSAYEVDEIDISSDTIVYDFECLNEDALIDINEIVIQPARYNSKVITQSNNRLIKGNLREREIDYKALQQLANNIETTYTTTAYRAEDTDLRGSSKSPFTSENGRSFMRDEVYAVFIQYLYNDGTLSQFIHVPPREKDTYADGTAMPNAADDPHRDWTGSSPTNTTFGRSHREIFTSGSWDSATGAASTDNLCITGTERWEFYNTALRTAISSDAGTGNNTISDFTEGELAYFESDQTYPDITDDSGTRVFPSGNVRYHKMPDATLEPIYYGPDSFQCWYGNNSGSASLVDLGLLDCTDFPLSSGTADGDTTWGSAQINPGTDWGYSIQLGLKFSNVQLPTDAIGYRIGYKRLNSVISKGYLTSESSTASATNYEASSNDRFFFFKPSSTTGENFVNYYSAEGAVNENSGLVGATYFKFENEYFTGSDTNNAVYADHYHLPDVPSATYHVSPRYTGDSILYNRCIADYRTLDHGEATVDIIGPSGTTATYENNQTTPTSITTTTDRVTIVGFDDIIHRPINGDWYTSMFFGGSAPNYEAMTAYYVGAKVTINPELFDNQAIEFYDFNFETGTESTMYGDVFITKIPTVSLATTNSGDATPPVFQIVEGYAETTYNTELHFYTDTDEDGGDDTYNYNLDYTVQPHTLVETAAQLRDYESSNGRFQNRIAWSEVSYQNDLVDSYTNFLANNFQDITDGTEINMLEEVNGRTLAVCSEKNFYQIPINSQELQADGVTVFLGTGSVLSTPPSKLSPSEYGFGGTQSPTSVSKSEAGLVWLDQNNNKVLNYLSSPEVLSNKGMNAFFRENLEFKADINFKETAGQGYPLVGHPDGVYTFTEFDPFYDRIMVHKYDWEPTFTWEIYDDEATYETGDYVFDQSDNLFKDGNSLVPVRPDTDPSLFRNYSYTISFSKGAWTSFHSYMPEYMFNDGRRLYTTQDNQIWVHTNNNFQSYYGTKEDYIIEFVAKSPQTTDLHSVQWMGEVLEWDTDTSEWKYVQDVSFDNIWVYNNFQSSGKLSLSFDSDYYTEVVGFDTPRVVESDGNYKVSRIRDYLTADNSAATSDWEDIRADFYIDKLPNSDEDSPSSYYEDPPIKAKWFKIRLYFNPTSDYKILTELVDTKRKPSVR